MEKVKLKNKIVAKRYIDSLYRYTFKDLLHFIQAIFESYEKGTAEIENIYLLLNELGYENLSQIKDIESVRDLITQKKEEWALLEDSEFLSYCLLDAFQRRLLTIIVDENVIKDCNSRITLTDDSIITFIKINQIDNLTFTTI